MRVALLIDLAPGSAYHDATVDALHHAAGQSGDALDLRVLRTDALAPLAGLPSVDGVVVGPGTPYRDEQAVWEAVRCARERGVPLVGT